MANDDNGNKTETRLHTLKWWLFFVLVASTVFWVLAFAESLPGQNFLNIELYFYFYVSFMGVGIIGMIALWAVNLCADHKSNNPLFKKHLPRLILSYALTTFLSCVLLGTYLSNKGFMRYLADITHYVSTYLNLGKQISVYNTMLVDFRITFFTCFALTTIPVYLNFCTTMLAKKQATKDKQK